MKLILEVEHITGYLKSHTNVEVESEKLEDMLNDFLKW